jgi:DeoR/GlpR family transcriptional regulator of sugar metabolism
MRLGGQAAGFRTGWAEKIHCIRTTAESGMLKDERQKLILETLRQNGRVLANELSQHFGVSEDTVRRDLRELAEAGQLERVHGGGLPHSPAAVSFRERMGQALIAKQEIARAAVRLVQNGQVLLLDGGTTTLAVARQLPPNLHVSVITNSPSIAIELAEKDRIEVVLIGGKLYKDSLVTTGSVALEMLRAIHVDLCMLGICSLHPEVGITTPDLEEAGIKRAMVACADQVVAMATAEKLNTASTHVVAPIHSLTYLITEQAVADEALDVYRLAGVTVIKA